MRYKTVKFSNLEIDNLLQEVKDGDIDVTVTEDDIDSGEATAGQVLTADGEGGAQFADPITYESKQAESGGTDVSLVTTGEKYTWNNKQDAITRDQPVDLATVVGLDSQDNVVTGDVRAANIDSGNATSGQVLTADGSGNAAWQTPSSGGMSNPMTTAGDIIVGGASGTPTRLGLGTAGQVLKVNASGTGLEYGAGGGGDTNSFKIIPRAIIKNDSTSNAVLPITIISQSGFTLHNIAIGETIVVVGFLGFSSTLPGTDYFTVTSPVKMLAICGEYHNGNNYARYVTIPANTPTNIKESGADAQTSNFVLVDENFVVDPSADDLTIKIYYRQD